MSKLINLTAKISDTGAYRGGILPQIKYSPISRRSVYSISTIMFSVHCATHIDLPWLVDWEHVKSEIGKNSGMGKNYSMILKDNIVIDDFIKKIYLEEEEEIEDYYLSPRTEGFEAIILNFNDKRIKLEKSLSKIGYQDDYPYYPYISIDEKNNPFLAQEIFDDLLISKEDLEKSIKYIKKKEGVFDLENKIIIFNTGWSENYYPLRNDISNPIFEGWHYYLTHPYLDLEATRFLMDEKILGVASDTPSLENPLLYVDFASFNFQPYLQQIGKRKQFVSIFGPLHLLMLSNQKFIIENLWNLEEIMTGDEKYKIGKIHIHPIPLGTEDATIINAFFDL